MSNLKYKSTGSASSAASSNQPIWCSLSTPSQIARKYASIAPIWCHISRPRQLKKKFQSTFNQAQSLLSRQHSKDSSNIKVSQSDQMDEDENNINQNSSWNTQGTISNSNSINDNVVSNSTNRLSPSSKTSSSNLLLKSKLLTNYNSINYEPANDLITENISSHRLTLKKRDSSLDVKRKTDKLPSNNINDNSLLTSNSYLYNSSLQNNSNPGSNLNSSRWPISSSSYQSNKPNIKTQYSLNNNKEILNDNNLSETLSTASSNAITTPLISDVISAPRRPHKYNASSKYLYPSSGSKTEKIISKSSKSSPNLLLKDHDNIYDHNISNKFDHHSNTSSGLSSKWLSSSSNTNSSITPSSTIPSSYISSYYPYHSNLASSSTNPYLSSNYSSYYQPSNYQSNINSNDSNSYINHHYTNYHNSSNREEKWNELDSMLGAQSALLSRLESDFVANRKKANQNMTLNNSLTSSSLASVTSNSTNSSGLYNHQLNAARSNLPSLYQINSSNSNNGYAGSSNTNGINNNNNNSNNNNININNKYISNYNGNQIFSKQQNILNENEKSSIVNTYFPSRFKTPTNTKYSSKYQNDELESLLNSDLDTKLNKSKKKVNNKKAEPIIDLIKSLNLTEEEKKLNNIGSNYSIDSDVLKSESPPTRKASISPQNSSSLAQSVLQASSPPKVQKITSSAANMLLSKNLIDTYSSHNRINGEDDEFINQPLANSIDDNTYSCIDTNIQTDSKDFVDDFIADYLKTSRKDKINDNTVNMINSPNKCTQDGGNENLSKEIFSDDKNISQFANLNQVEINEMKNEQIEDLDENKSVKNINKHENDKLMANSLTHNWFVEKN